MDRYGYALTFGTLTKNVPRMTSPCPFTEQMVDATIGYVVLSFMDGYFDYNQILMAEEDKLHTSFKTPEEIYFYRVIPFSLKNARATYQRAMTHIFVDLLHNKV